MRTAARLFIGSAIFFAVLFGIYWFTSYEPAGGTLLALGLPATLMVGLYLRRYGRSIATGSQDRSDSPAEEAQGEVVAVPAPSLWPVGVAFGAGTFSAGLVLGLWLLIPGAVVMAASIIASSLTGRDYPSSSSSSNS